MNRVEAVSCRDLSVRFDGVQALYAVNLSFKAPAIIAIIGPNGAGKTTLLNVITGFLRPDTGTCHVEGKLISGMPPWRVSNLGIARTFQDLRLVRSVSVLENVLLARPRQSGERLIPALVGRSVRREEEQNREAAIQALVAVGLDRQASALAGELSYGQQKLLTLACCLASGAKVLLFDEPVAGVHPDLASQILEYLVERYAEGRLVVFIEHDLDAVRRIAQRLVVMDEGRVVADGPTLSVLKQPAVLEAYVG